MILSYHAVPTEEEMFFISRPLPPSFSLLIFAVQTADRLLVWRNIEGAVSLVDHHARSGARWLFDVFDARVIHGHIAAALRL